MKKGQKVYVGMSGGVDSSVSAALLKDQGYDVTGVFIKVWHPDWLPCEWKEERRDAMRVAAAIDIPFLTFDFQDEYKKGVVDYMLDEYKKGRTPNPDVMCNKEIKFGSFLKKAQDMGADFIATGHYAETSPSPLLGKEGEEGVVLTEGADKNKDQSYFLWTMGQKELEHTLFPVGHLQKSEVRELAKKFKLPTAEKKDSQGICFIGKVDMKEFLSHYIEAKPGRVFNENGEEIGKHDGALFYTIGQRHGFEIIEKSPEDKPYYIIAKDIEENTLTVSHKIHDDEPIQAVTKIELSEINWINEPPKAGEKYSARIRYRQKHQGCEIQGSKIIFSTPQDGVSVGQSVVVYDGERCLGGGIIASLL